MPHDHDPLVRLGQGTSQTVWTGGFWHEPHTPPSDARTVHVWLAGDNTYHRGFRGCNMWVIYDRHGNPVHVEDDTVIGWQDFPSSTPAVVPPVRNAATELAVVGAGVIAIMIAMWWWPLLGLGAAAMAAVFAVACWVGGGK